jgi:hypothetical protein
VVANGAAEANALGLTTQVPTREVFFTSGASRTLQLGSRCVELRPVIDAALAKAGLEASLTLAGKDRDKLTLAYPAVKTGTGYSAPTIHLEFGARATGEPHHVQPVACDIAPEIEGVTFPVAQPLVMAAERTFWEKTTAAHVYCLQGRLRGER